jgi:hypothetical protein
LLPLNSLSLGGALPLSRTVCLLLL